MTLMQGPRPVREDIAAHLAVAVPEMITKAEVQWGRVIESHPALYSPYEPTGLDHNSPPVVAVGIQRGSRFTTQDIDNWGAFEYRVEYAVSIYLWCFTPLEADGSIPLDSRERSLKLRDELATVLRATLLQRPSLGHPDRYQTVENSLEEEYSEATPAPNSSGRFVSGSIHRITVKADEKLDMTGTTIVERPVGLETGTFD